jgi:hypothetical protein
MFVGYDDKSKAYRLYLPKQKKIAISRDVIFDEGKVGINFFREEGPDKDPYNFQFNVPVLREDQHLPNIHTEDKSEVQMENIPDYEDIKAFDQPFSLPEIQQELQEPEPGDEQTLVPRRYPLRNRVPTSSQMRVKNLNQQITNRQVVARNGLMQWKWKNNLFRKWEHGST